MSTRSGKKKRISGGVRRKGEKATLKQKDARLRHYETQAALIESEERFRRLAENAEDLIYRYELSPRRGFSYVSPAAAKMTGYAPEEYYADPDLWMKIIHPDDRPLLRERFDGRGRSPSPHSLRWIRKDGTVVWAEHKDVLIRNGSEGAVAIEGIVRDVTDRKRAEEALRESEEQYRALFENDPAGGFVADADGRIVSCNRAFAAVLGFRAAEEAVRLNFFEFCRDPRQREDFLQILGGRRNVERLEMEFVRRDGSLVYARVNAYGVFAADRALLRIVGFLVDETERRHLEERLARTQKLESLGTLAGGIAHDFNNVLNIILGYLSLLEKAGGAQAEVSRLGHIICRAAERGADLVRQLLTFVRKNDPRRDPIRLAEVVGEVVKLARETFPRTIAIRNDPAAAAPVVTADANQLHQAFLNLFLNARDAMPAGGALTVSEGTVDRTLLASRYPETEGDEYAFVRIEDTGTGMDDEVKQHVFEPFFTTKDKGVGTGLGLALVYGIVREHRGFIEVESEPGKGAAFTVYLPARAEAERPARAAPAGGARPEGGNETILLIEDEETLRDFFTTVLKSKGYRVLAAADGGDAWDVYEGRRGAIDLIVSNYGLPGLDGGELFKRVKAVDAGVPMVLMSGFIDPGMRPLLEKIGVTGFLQKPFTPAALLEAVRGALEKNATERPQPAPAATEDEGE